MKDSRYLVGDVSRLLGKFEKAKKFFRDSLDDSKAFSFPVASVARSNNHLALVMRQQQATLTLEREKEGAGLEADTKEVRDCASSLI